MKKLFVELILLLAFLAGVFFFFEWQFSGKWSMYDYVFYDFKKSEPSVTQINIGNSHIQALGEDGLTPIDTTYNLGLGGLDIFHAMTILEKVIPASPRLKTVLLGVDYDLLGYNFTLEKEAWKDRQLYPFTGRLYDDSWGNRLISKSNFFRLNRDLRFLFIKSDSSLLSTTTNFIPIDPEGLTEVGAKRRATEHSVTKFDSTLINENLLYLDSIILFCKKHDVQLLIVNTPKSPAYTRYYNPKTISQTRDRIAELMNANGLVYYDFFPDSSFHKNDFIDSDHLNANGAHKFISKLRAVVISPQ